MKALEVVLRRLKPFLNRTAELATLQKACGMYGAATSNKVQPSFGLLFDIDGVLVRGKAPIPAAKKAFQKLLDSRGHFLVPVVFVTNAGNCLRQTKADQLSHILGVPICPDQVMLSHSPLRMFRKYHDKCVLVSGQGPVLDIANNLGFQKVVTIDMLREHFPMLDMVDHNRRPKRPSSPTVKLPNVEALILFGEPVRWETNLQLIIDVLLTNGSVGNAHDTRHHAHLPLFACNMDLMWMAEAQSPRFGHGMFLVCLENIYRKITGQELKYEALMGKPSELTYHYAEYLIREQAAERGWTTPIRTLYAIGDNLMTDIYGANLYNRYLEERSWPRKTAVQVMQANVGGIVGRVSSEALPQDQDLEMVWERELAPPSATSCKSVLVCTGVYNPHAGDQANASHSTAEIVFHGHRDFQLDPALVEPGHMVQDVQDAVELIFQQENLVPTREP
ncbi:hypothetical protein UPYG_G00092770 [Umbra pygmaea]|uniref:Haloacid dehalogenase-like hydrolase domain-containing 5 n=1 Tax=Umbra pygmaea TaxID=75934 RepID=A0ABD0XVA2_UMBPY